MLAQAWRRDAQFISSVTEMAMHPAYQQIIGMGREALPLILRELWNKQDHWFWALKAISGGDPVPPEHQGKLDKMTEIWLHWGKQNRYI
ncbi:MAG: hypothetical protein HYU64_10805 [Armatimonadetes bacterium]|nr:hypothetical protein [Armatimonadota bacterium]